MYRALQLKVFLVVGLLLLTACGPSLAGTPITDKEFDAAVNEAHKTLSTLRQALLAPQASYEFVGVKVRFRGEGVSEDIWTEPVDYVNNYFTIRMLSGVLIDPNLNAERIVTVPLDDVLDWVLIEEDGTLIGGYTIRLSYEHMTPKEQGEFLEATGYKMD